MINLVKKYNSYLEILPELIEKSNYKLEYFIKILDVSKPTMYRKLREKAFTNIEVQKLTEILFPKEVYLEEIREDLKKSREDITEGRVLEHSEVMKALRRDYL